MRGARHRLDPRKLVILGRHSLSLGVSTMKVRSTLLVVGAAVLSLIASPALAAPSASGALLDCPTRCAILGPVTGSDVLPSGNALNFYANWTVLSTSTGAPAAVTYLVQVSTSGSGNATNYTGTGSAYLYAYSPSPADSEYRILTVTAKVTQGVVQVDSIGSSAVKFSMVATRVPFQTNSAGFASLRQGFGV